MDEQRHKKTRQIFMNFGVIVRSLAAASLAIILRPSITVAADSGADLAAGLRSKEQGSTFIRMRMQIGGGENQVFQIQVKSRVSEATSDIVYQILFPKERKGESVLLHRSGEKFTGTMFATPGSVRPIGSGQMTQPLFGSDLSYEDIIDSPFRWSQQAIIGTELIDNIPCQILQSKPGKGHSSSYSSVKTWVDPRRLVPLQIEKYDSADKVVRRINITRVLLDGSDSLPANLKVYGPRGTTTEIDGSRIRRGITYADMEFTADGLKQLSTPQEPAVAR